MQPLPFLVQAISRIRRARQHTSASGPPINFHNQTFANQGNQESRYEFAARRSLYAGSVPNIAPSEVRWKNPLRHLVAETKISTACRKFALNSFPAFHMLELAKGFEPLTL